MPNALVSKHHALSKFLATQSVVGILHISFWRKQSQCNFMWFKQINLAFCPFGPFGFPAWHRTTPGSWALALATHWLPAAMHELHSTCPVWHKLDNANDYHNHTCLHFCLHFFCCLDFGLHVFFVACTLARTFFVAWTLTSTSVGGLHFGLHFFLWLGLWLALFFVAWTLACAWACTWIYGLQLFDPLWIVLLINFKVLCLSSFFFYNPKAARFQNLPNFSSNSDSEKGPLT